MNRQFPLALMSMIITLNLCATKNNPFETDASNAQYIEMHDMQPTTHATSHTSIPGDQYEVPYQPLGASQHHDPDNDLKSAKLSRSTMHRRIFGHTLPEQGLFLILKVCFPCCFQPIPRPPTNETDSL